jgi:hypothetical protein
VAAYVGIDWADQKHDVVLRSAGDPAKPEHQVTSSFSFSFSFFDHRCKRIFSDWGAFAAMTLDGREPRRQTAWPLPPVQGNVRRKADVTGRIKQGIDPSCTFSAQS